MINYWEAWLADVSGEQPCQDVPSLCLEGKANFHCNNFIRSLSLEMLLVSLLCKQILLLSKWVKDMKTTTKNHNLEI